MKLLSSMVMFPKFIIRKKTAAIHFPTIPYDSNTAIFFANFVLVPTKLCVVGLEFLEIFCAFL